MTKGMPASDTDQKKMFTFVHDNGSDLMDSDSDSFLTSVPKGPQCRRIFSSSLTPTPRKPSSQLLESLTINKLNFSRLGLYGRDHEVSVLKDCLNRLSSGQVERELALISGYSGTGKTSLAGTLKEPTTTLNGIYVQGKFDLYTRNEPYIGIASASAQLCAHILSLKGEAVSEQILVRIKEDLRAELSLLIRFIPIMSKLVSREGEDESVATQLASLPSAEEAKNQFIFAFLRFVEIVSEVFAPLVFVLDDLQWADGSSLDLIDALVTNRKSSKIMVVGLYRSNEVDHTSIFYRYLDGFRMKGKENAFQLTEMIIGNLDLVSVETIVGELLSMESSERAVQLSQVCFEKTQGNALFLLHFLSMLNTHELLLYNLGLAQWTWDIHEIKAKTSISNNVVDLLKSKILELSSNSIIILKVAASLGSSFQEQAVKIVVEHFTRDELHMLAGNSNCVGEIIQVDRGLAELEQDGYIKEMAHMSPSLSSALPLSSSSSRTFMWTHDKIHEAAASLKDNTNDEWLAFEYRMGSILSTALDPIELHSAIFVVADLLNHSLHSEVITKRMDENERVRIASLNLQASEKAVSLSAFESTAAYAAFGINLLPENHWTSHYQLSLALYSIGAKSEGYGGNQDAMNRYCDKVLSLPNATLEHKLEVYHALIDSHLNDARTKEASDLILQILKHYGCNFPTNSLAIAFSIIRDLIKVKASAKSRDIKSLAKSLANDNDDDDEELTEMTDSMRIEMMKLIDKLAVCWYRIKDRRLALAPFRTLEWTRKYGFCGYSSLAIARAATILTGVLGDIQGGEALAKRALKLLEKFPSSVTYTRTLLVVHGFVFPWTIPFVQVQKSLLHTYDAGLQCGDTEAAMLASHLWLLDRFISGGSLVPLELDFQLYTKQMKDLGRKQYYYLTSYTRQALLNLMGRNGSRLLELIGDAFSEEEMSVCKVESDCAFAIPVLEGILQTFFGHHLQHADTALKCHHDYLQKTVPAYPLIPFDHCAKSVSCFVAASLMKKKKKQKQQQKYLKMAEKLRGKIKNWKEMGNPNVKQFDYLLDAESDRFHGKNQGAIQNYEAAILLSGRTGCQHTAAYASERLADFQLEVIGDKEEALYRIKQSISYWKEYGALAKVTDLEVKYSHLLLLQQQQHQQAATAVV